ncbi:hypothetical protein V1517DRAFT_320200 [Lipomyces orientalis]|uniref:Uncharacterized protein n=1 Tax=Lipomyces orientalis TaxID=1233043 RepID=A0ACC3TRR1_9ASCO
MAHSPAHSTAFLSTHLSTFDDFLTVVLVDALYFWIPVHKVHPGRRTPRGPSPSTLTALFRAHAYDSSLTALVSAFLALPSIKSYVAGLSHTPRLRHEFEAHARRYLAMYSPTVPFELGTTERYRAVSRRSETCVLARRPIAAGTTIQHLSGKMVALSPQDEKSLKRDFSIIYSHRLGESCLMLGPCRFVNHDCNPNARFMAQGSHGVVAVVAVRKIEVGEEITVSYADNYFGKKNRECMCGTCERRGKGFFEQPRAPPSSKSRSQSRSASESGVTSESGTETEVDSNTSDDSSSEYENGIRRHRTRARKRRRLEMLDIPDKPMSVSPHPSLSRSLWSASPKKELIKTEEVAVENYGHTFSSGCRRSTRNLQVRAPVKKDYEDVTAPKGTPRRIHGPAKRANGPDICERVNMRSSHKRVLRPQASTGTESKSVRGRQRHAARVKTPMSQTSTQRKKHAVRDRRTGLSTPPLSVSETNDDAGDAEWDSDADADLYDTWTSGILFLPDLIYNAYWGALELENIGTDSKFPCSQQSTSLLGDTRAGIVPPFQTRKCANKNCHARFLLARRGRGGELERACAEYVRKFDVKCAAAVACLKCNRHAGIYGLPWPEIKSPASNDEGDDKSAEDGNSEEAQLPVAFVSVW